MRRSSPTLTPVPDELEAHDLPVEGTLPPELDGRYLRNGPNPRPGEAAPPHWFLGRGMLHGVRLKEGRALWYRNRWVRSETSAANTAVLHHSGRLFALIENTPPVEIDDELGTIGTYDFGGRLTTAMTAHPKVDSETGELHFFGYGPRPPHLTYHRLDPAGNLVHSEPVAVPAATMMHDFAITRNHVVWLDLPVVFDRELVGRTLPYSWSDSYGVRLGVMPKSGGPVQWFDVEPGYVFHVGHASEDAAGRVVLTAVRWGREGFTADWPTLGVRDESPAHLHEWTLDPATGTVTERALDDRGVEFYAVGANEIIKYDATSGAARTDYLGAGWRAGEAVFVPGAEATGEDEGWLISIAGHTDPAVPARLLVHDATAVEKSPVATVTLPRRVPLGFHGTWVDAG
ncbi:carotenoid oxygenase family protein [Cryptosporangium japonicum]|uniref:carotenoid oxygenase family protein n=1 Tax=Cryptosporangium japonicum TaxID=80872 RepID=UPI0031DAE96E